MICTIMKKQYMIECMINIRIEKREYKLPTLLSEISIKDGMRIKKIYDDYSGKQVTAIMLKSILSILMKCPVSVLNKVNAEELVALYYELSYLTDELIPIILDGFVIDGVEYGRVCISDMTVEEYHDLEILKKDVVTNMGEIMALVYRPIVSKDSIIVVNKGDKELFGVKPLYFKSYEVEKYNDKTLESRGKILYSELNYQIALSILQELICETKDIYSKYPSLFGTPKKNEKLLFEDEYAPDDVDEDETSTDRSFESDWGIVHLLMMVTEGSKSEEIIWMKRPVGEFFQRLSYMIQKAQVEKEELKNRRNYGN